MFENLLLELTSSPLLMRESAQQSVDYLCMKIIKGEKIDIQQPQLSKYIGMVVPDPDLPNNPFDSFEENSIAVIPIIGVMLKYGWNYGMDDVANLIRLADNSPNIVGTILLLNTPGGTTQSVIQLEDAMRNRTKPCISFIDGMCCSGGIYIASFSDKIIASNRMCEIGSIGTELTMRDYSKLFEDLGIKVVKLRPPESKFKNTEYEEALKGNDKRLIEESLTPFAIHFQNIIKENRPGIDLSVEGIIEGKVFYAYDAITYGLIDGITNFEESATILRSLVNDDKTLYSPFN